MAMVTWLQLIDTSELTKLEAAPENINQLDKLVCFSTYFFASLNYFMTGDAYPSNHPLALALGGDRSVETATLECGHFSVLDSDHVAALLQELHAIDRVQFRTAVESADYERLVEEQECYEFEVFEADQIPNQLMADLNALIVFYEKVDEAGGAMVAYTC